jgi:glycosyltransferase involved in cell wall biosynthesis
MKLKQRYNFPLAVNLTDPLPAPIEYVPNGPLRDKLISSARTIISQSDIVMMGTEKAIEYECSIVGSLHRCKFRVSPDPVPSSKISILPHNNQSTTNLVYLGSIYGSRNILPLVEAMEMLRNEGVNISLTICSDPQKDAIRRDFIHYIGWVSDIMKILSNADILVDIDGDDSKPVFISSKLKQYLTINRPILSITPSGSPAAELLNGMETVYVCNNSVDLILENLKNMTSQSFVIDNYAERSMLLREFSIETVTTDLLRALEEICI